MFEPKTDERQAHLRDGGFRRDPRFNEPSIDVRESHDEPADAPGVPRQHHDPARRRGAGQGSPSLCARRVHGYRRQVLRSASAEEEYQGRFFQATHQLLARGGGHGPQRYGPFTLASGGYSVQTNMGGRDNPSRGRGVGPWSGRHDDSGLPGQRGGGEILPCGGGRAVRPAPQLRLSLRRQRRRLPDGHQRGDDERRVGRFRALRHGLAAVHPELFHRAGERPAGVEGQVAVDHRHDRPGRER